MKNPDNKQTIPAATPPVPVKTNIKKQGFNQLAKGIISEEQRVKIYKLPLEVSRQQDYNHVRVKSKWLKRLIKETIVQSGDKLMNITDIYVISKEGIRDDLRMEEELSNNENSNQSTKVQPEKIAIKISNTHFEDFIMQEEKNQTRKNSENNFL